MKKIFPKEYLYIWRVLQWKVILYMRVYNINAKNHGHLGPQPIQNDEWWFPCKIWIFKLLTHLSGVCPNVEEPYKITNVSRDLKLWIWDLYIYIIGCVSKISYCNACYDNSMNFEGTGSQPQLTILSCMIFNDYLNKSKNNNMMAQFILNT